MSPYITELISCNISCKIDYWFQNFFTETEAEDTEVDPPPVEDSCRLDSVRFSPFPPTPPKRRPSEQGITPSSRKPLITLHECTQYNHGPLTDFSPRHRGRSINLPSSAQKNMSSLRDKLESQLGGDLDDKATDIMLLVYRKVCNVSTQIAEQTLEIRELREQVHNLKRGRCVERSLGDRKVQLASMMQYDEFLNKSKDKNFCNNLVSQFLRF